MKNIRPAFCCLLLVIFLAQWGMSQTSQSLIEGERKAFQQKLRSPENALTADYDIIYHRLEWDVNPAVKYISGEITSYFSVLEEDFQTVHFDLATNMQVNEVLYHGEVMAFEQLPGDLLKIDLPAPLAQGTIDSISVDYEGIPTSSGFGNFIQSSHGSQPILWTFSVPYGAREWWPCKQSLTDKVDSIDIYITTAPEHKAASNGALISITEVGEKVLHHWRHRYPIASYLIAFSVTNYASYSEYVHLENGDSIEILNYVYPENLASAKTQTVRLKEVMELYNELLGIYPYASEKYGHAQFGFGGGMEHQTMSFMGSFNYSLIAHELAHQWFGDKVTYGSWRDAWLSEGFATYLAGVIYEYLGQPAEWRQWKISQIYNVTLSSGGSVWVDDTTSVGRIFDGRLTYDKGSLLVHMLRWVLGDEAFYQGLRDYLDDPELAYGFARTEDLQLRLENASGLDLSDFIEDWFYGQGYPSYQVFAGVSGNSASLRIEQTTSHNSVDFFEMPIPLLFIGDGVDTLIRLDHSFSGEKFNVEVDFDIENIRFDPDFRLLSKNNTVEISSALDEVQKYKLKVFPNPAGGQLNVESRQGMEGAILYDGAGNIVREEAIASTKYEFNTAGLPQGIYLLQVDMKGKRIIRQIAIGSE